MKGFLSNTTDTGIQHGGAGEEGFNKRVAVGGIKIMTGLGYTYIWIWVESLVGFLSRWA